ncbi:Syd protein [Pseudoalteromonas luteoviolacea B = ATCC 29581]|nr:Syd protein [Pseudoalteromonas luteoviolacea B = ATCC 29581]
MSISTLLASLLHEFKSVSPTTYFDEQWPSPCEVGKADEQGNIAWQPVSRKAASLTALFEALEVVHNEELSTFYSAFYSANLAARFDGHQIELLQAWSEEDFERLQQNITGHVLMKRRLKQPETIFIGLTEHDEILITVELSSGKVCLEKVGKRPHHVLASSLGEFLSQITVS